MSLDIVTSKFLIWISKIERSIRSKRAEAMFQKNHQLYNSYGKNPCTAMNIVFSFGALCIMFLLYHLSTFTHREQGIAPYNSNQVLNNTADYFKSPNYLYRSSLYVMELGPPKHDKLVNGKDPVVIVYYAPWCGHCRHFVPKYNELAMKTNAFIADSNRKSINTYKQFRNITFASVNCVDQKSICNSIGVGAYPTVIVYHVKAFGPIKRARNYGTKKDPDSEWFSSRDNEITAFIEGNYLLGPHFNIIPPDVATTSASPITPAITAPVTASNPSVVTPPVVSSKVVVDSNINSLSRVASPYQRLQDGLTSFNFLLLDEVPDVMTPEKIKALLNFMEILVITLPTTEVYLSVYNDIIELLKKASEAGKSYFRANKDDKKLSLGIKSRLTAANITVNNLAWQTCGLFSKHSVTGTSSGVNNPRIAARMNRRNERRKARLERDMKRLQNNSNSSLLTETEEEREEGDDAVQINRDVGTGYTCGVWFIFHYIAANQNIKSLNAVNVMEGLYQLVAQFFSCDMCRNHFIEHYKSCKFNRCDIKETDFDQLQLWLFHTHNYVTYGIVLEEQKSPLSNMAISEYLWPNQHQQCRNCTNVVDYYNAKNNIIPPEPAGARMKHAKKDGTPIVPLTAKSIQNSKILAFLKESYTIV